jgi:hypothetical protein
MTSTTSMTTVKACMMIALAGLVLAGCQPATLVMKGEHKTISAGDIAVSLEVPKRVYNVGEKFRAVVHVQNKTNRPVTISADTSAPVLARLSHYTNVGEVELKHYPQFSQAVMKSWTLRPGEVRSFPLELTVEPDWPRGELLRMVGQVNGRPEIQPGVAISIN